MISFLARTGLREYVKAKCRDSHKTVLFFLRALLLLARVSFKLDRLSRVNLRRAHVRYRVKFKLQLVR